MKKFVIAGIVVLVLMAGGVAAFTMQRTASAQAEQPATAAAAEPNRGVVAEGVVVPVEWAAVSSQAGGRVAEVLVREGEQVTAGQAMVRVESSRQAAAVAQAEAGLARAQARLAELKAGPRAEEIAVAESAVSVAQAQLGRAQQGAKAEDVAAAEAAVAAAQASLNKVLEGAAPGALDRSSHRPGQCQGGAGSSASRVTTRSRATRTSRPHLSRSSSSRRRTCTTRRRPVSLTSSVGPARPMWMRAAPVFRRPRPS